MIGIQDVEGWFSERGWKPFKFQIDTWNAFNQGKSGLVNAPTGSGKTYSLLVPIVIEHQKLSKNSNSGLCAIWITPIRALAKEILNSTQRLVDKLNLDFSVEIRSGDSTAKVKAKHKLRLPNLLITTPESLHILMSQSNFSRLAKGTFTLVADEWHELLSSKRGVQLELALSRLRALNPNFRTWGISATIGNLEQGAEVLLGSEYLNGSVLINSGIKKKIEVKSILPDEVESFPWTGHLGVKLIKKILPLLRKSKSTLIFTNTRAQSEIWYNRLMEVAPEFAGLAALHHSSLSKKVRHWVEDALQCGELKVVICTSSLDLGVDFSPVETIIQIGGPKGVSRFIQRAGRSGHRPGALSKIYFLPTHSLELIEGAALREAISRNFIEKREPYYRCFDVLIQYLLTLAVGEGFDPEATFEEVRSTHCYASMNEEEWNRLIHFIKTGGDALASYDEHQKAVSIDGIIKVVDTRFKRRHKMSIGTIVSDTVMKIKYKSGGFIGTVEERFMNRLKPGDVFWFSGRSLELVSVKHLTAKVINSKRKTQRSPAWMGGQLPLSSNLSSVIRDKINEFVKGNHKDKELKAIAPMLEFQQERSHIPASDECLVEYFKTEQGYHLLVYPFEGRFVNEGISFLLAERISRILPISFSLAFNDYGFELLSDQSFHPQLIEDKKLFSSVNLHQDIFSGLNSTEMARRKFRDIASISGLVFKGFPGQNIKDTHLQSSSELFFKVFSDYDPNNLLLLQSFDEALHHQLEYERLKDAVKRIETQKLVIKYPENPTPFSFPIMVDRLREKLTSESLAARVQKMTVKYKQ